MNVVYIKHFENGKKYVGITSNFKKRMNQHKNPKHKEQHLPIYKAMNKHDHYTEIVFESELYKDVQEMERIIIRNFKDLGIGLYNLTDGGEGSLGLSPSKETRLKKSVASSGENNPMYGKKHSEEAILKMIGANKGEKSFRANPKEHYETYPTRRDKFKRTCERMGWEYLSFKETFSGEYYVDTNGGKKRKYFYLFLGEGVSREVDWDSTINRPKEYYATNCRFRSDFKHLCDRSNWIFEDFEEIFSGEYYQFKTCNSKSKKYFYIYKGGRDDK